MHHHYSLKNNVWLEGGVPTNFIDEGLYLTRLWSYTLIVLATALFDKLAFKYITINGLVLDGDGKKMSNLLNNYPDTKLLINNYGANAFHMYLIKSPVVRA